MKIERAEYVALNNSAEEYYKAIKCATQHAQRLGPNQLISITEFDRGDGHRIVIWYWTLTTG